MPQTVIQDFGALANGHETPIAAGTAAVRSISNNETRAASPAAANAKADGIFMERVTKENQNVTVLTSGEFERAVAASAISAGDKVNVADSSGRFKSANGSVTIDPSGNNNSLLFTNLQGSPVESIEYRATGNDAALSHEMEGSNLVFNLATDSAGAITTTADLLKTYIATLTTTVALWLTAVDADSANDGSGALTAMPAAQLVGGANIVGTALTAASGVGAQFRLRVEVS